MPTKRVRTTPAQRNTARSSPRAAPRLVLRPGAELSPDEVERFALLTTPKIEISPGATRAMRAAQKTLDRLLAAGAQVYGVTTGFGPFVRCTAGARGSETHGLGLVNHLCAGFGEPAADEVVRAAMIVRARALVEGRSAVSPTVLTTYLAMIGAGVVPEVPELGSVGASGDLIPLAFIARALLGLGRATRNGKPTTAAAALRAARLRPISPTSRDVLGLVNGTSFMTAYALLALRRAERLIAEAEGLTGWAYRLLGCRAQALDPRLHHARGHVGQALSAAATRAEATRFGPFEDASRPLQEVYSLRCAPQILGACRDQLAYARDLITREINGVNDNPLVFPHSPDGPAAALHGGNFQGQQIAFASDAISAAITQVAVLVERQIDVILSPAHNGNAPLLLAWDPGPCSGFAGAQITATALVADMRHHAHPAATSSIPTNGGNQDVVSMGTNAARHAYHQGPRCAAVIAVMALSLHRLRDLRLRGRAPTPPGARSSAGDLPPWLPTCRTFTVDVPLHDDIRELANRLLSK